MSNPNPQMLILDPKEELKFYGDFSEFHQPKTKLVVTNPTPYSIHFKIKTTAASRYWVTPKMGLLLPYSQETVTIGMKAPRDRYKAAVWSKVQQVLAQENEPTTSIRFLRGALGDTSDKFKVLAMVSTGQKTANFWDSVDDSKAMTSKLVVVFVDENESEMKSSPHTHTAKKCDETVPSLAKILTFIIVGIVAIGSSLYRLGTK